MKPAIIGIAAKKIIVVPCKVKNELYSVSVRKVFSGTASCILNNRARKPPTRKKKNPYKKYRIPTSLWSVVVSQGLR